MSLDLNISFFEETSGIFDLRFKPKYVENNNQVT